MKEVIPILKTLSPEFKKYLSGVALFSLASSYSMFMFFILSANFALKNVLGPALAVAFPLLLHASSNMISSIFSLPAGILFDKLGGEKALFIGYLLYAISCLGFIWAEKLVWFGILFAIYGISTSFTEATQRAFTFEFAKKEMQGTFAGIFQSSKAIASLIGGILVGALWAFCPAVAFAYAACLSLFASIMIVKLDRFSPLIKWFKKKLDALRKNKDKRKE